MNQFKRAKQINSQSESASDLKTAGIATPALESTQPITSKEDTVLTKQTIPTETTENNTTVVAQTPKAETAADSTPTEKNEPISKPDIYNEASASNTATVQPQNIPAQQMAPPVVQPQYSQANVTYNPEPIEQKPVKSGKKSAPNMFTQKNESKSIRKSLVLRPSSVKIAENYCTKNGGSFNELIQILLDNFIEEYGL